MCSYQVMFNTALSHGVLQRVLKCVLTYGKFYHLEVTLCRWQDIEVQLLAS